MKILENVKKKLEIIEMRTIIAGSRSITNYEEVKKYLYVYREDISKVLCGCAKGVDEIRKQFAYEYTIPIEYYPADWNKYGKRAGYIRNIEMAKNADFLIAIWDGKSKGTKNMIDIATKAGLKVITITWGKE